MSETSETVFTDECKASHFVLSFSGESIMTAVIHALEAEVRALNSIQAMHRDEPSANVSALAAELCRKHNDADRVAVWEIHDVEALIRRQFRESTPSPVIEGKGQAELIERLRAEIFAWREADMYCDLLGYLNGDYDKAPALDDGRGAVLKMAVCAAQEAVGTLPPPRPAFVAPEKPELVLVRPKSNGAQQLPRWMHKTPSGYASGLEGIAGSEVLTWDAYEVEVLDPNSGEPVR